MLPSPRLAWRVQELVAAEYRLGVSRGITDVVHDADSGRLPGASPLNRVAVRSARPQLLALASRLADLDVHVLPRGVLLADRLVTDSHSPLYDRARAELAGREAERALTALERRVDGVSDRGRAGRACGASSSAARWRPTRWRRRCCPSGWRSRSSPPTRSRRSRTQRRQRSSCSSAPPPAPRTSRFRSRSASPGCSRSSSLSYRQTVLAYETSGGAYIVAKENLGRVPSLVAAAALLTDYILTVAVSVAAGVLALTSAVTGLQGHELALSLMFVVLITLANLRGVKEAGVLFALPTYAFVTSIFVLIGTGDHPLRDVGLPAGGGAASDRLRHGRGHPVRRPARVRLRLDGVDRGRGDRERRERLPPPARPQRGEDARDPRRDRDRDVRRRLVARRAHARPAERPRGHRRCSRSSPAASFPAGSWSGFMYWAVQILTLAVLVLAANTSFQGFPRLAALLARDRFFARQFTNLGDRLVFSNGIIVLATAASRVARRLQRERRLADPPLRDRRVHRVHAVAGGDGALLAANARRGLALPRPAERRRRDRDRARHVDRDLDEVHRGSVAGDRRDPAVRALVRRDQPPLPALRAAPGGRSRRGSCGRHSDEPRPAVGRVARRRHRGRAVVRAPDRRRRLDPRTAHPGPAHGPGDPAALVRLRAFRAEARARSRPTKGAPHAVLEEVWRLPRGESDFVTVVVPEQFRARSLFAAATRTSFRLKLRLLSEPGTVVADVPVVSRRNGPEGSTPSRLAVRVLLADVHAGSMRALTYARVARDRGHSGRLIRLRQRGGEQARRPLGRGGNGDAARPERRSVS